MTIIHKLVKFLFTLFPELASTQDKEQIHKAIEKYYSIGEYKPKVKIEGLEFNFYEMYLIKTMVICNQDSQLLTRNVTKGYLLSF